MDIEKAKRFSIDKIKEETLAKYVKNVIENEKIKKQDYREGFKRYYNQNQDIQSGNITDWLDKIKLNKFSNLSNLGNIIRDKLTHDSIKNKSYFSNDVLDNLERLNYNILRLVNKPPPPLQDLIPLPLEEFPPPPPPLQDLIPLPLEDQEEPFPPPPPPLQDLIPLPLEEFPPSPLQVEKTEPNSRENLLDAIIKGVKLKPVKPVKKESKSTNTLTNIMDDAFLKMRPSIAPYPSDDDDDDDENNYFSD